MICVNSLKLTNFGCYRAADLVFPAVGVIGIVGPNGSGKSTILEAIRFLISGRVSGTLSTMVTTGESAGKVSGEITITLPGQQPFNVAITRPLQGRHTAKLAGTKVTGAKAVTEKLQELLGVSPVRLVETSLPVFSAQTALLTAAPVERVSLWERLLDCEKFRAARACAVKHLKAAAVTDFSDAISSLRAGIERNEQQHHELEDKFLSIKLGLEAMRLVENDMRAMVTEAHKRASSNREATANAEAISRLQRKIDELAQRKTENQRKLDDAVVEQLRLRTECERLGLEPTATAAQIRTIRNYAAEKSTCQREVERLQKSLDKTAQSMEKLAGCKEQLEQAQQQQHAAMAEKELADEVLSHMSQDGTCYVCKQDISELNLAQTYEAQQKRAATILDKLYVELIQLRQQSAHLDSLSGRREQIEKDLSKASTALRVAKKRLPANEATTPRQIDGLLADMDRMPDAQACRDAVENIERQLAELCLELTKLEEAGLSFITPTKAQLEAEQAAEKGLERISQLEGQMIATQPQLKRYEKEASELHSDLERMTAKQEGVERQKAFYDLLQVAVDLLHPSKLPRKYMSARLHEVEADINATLQNMSSRFSVSITDECEILAVFEDGLTRSTTMMSPGELLRLAVALRIALQRCVVRSGIMSFDEPTAHLDENSRDAVGLAADALKDGVSQVFLITHYAPLCAKVDRLIRVAQDHTVTVC